MKKKLYVLGIITVFLLTNLLSFSITANELDMNNYTLEGGESTIKSDGNKDISFFKNNTTISPNIFGYDIAHFSGKVTDFYQDEDVITFYAISVKLKGLIFYIAPLPLGKIIIPVPLGERYIDNYENEPVEIIKDNYYYQKYFFRCKGEQLTGFAIYFQF